MMMDAGLYVLIKSDRNNKLQMHTHTDVDGKANDRD